MPVPNLNPWSYKYIRRLTEEATEIARHDGLRPALASEVLMTWRQRQRFNIPFLGDYVPEGWERTGEIGMVDRTGRALQGDPAMPALEFLRQVHELKDKSLGLGVIETGQTQVLVATYKRKESDAQNQTR